ncbi:hypothetical protein IAQ61_007210 [Plenodomus lingam]|nr:hypothetical protein IAQ61_007210 [Plenodomus lingam]
MPEKSAVSVPPLRTSEEKLYQACLDACIAGLENLPVDKRQAVPLAVNNNSDPTTFSANNTNITAIGSTKPGQGTVETDSAKVPLGANLCDQQLHATPSSTAGCAEVMDQSKYANTHGTPPKGPRSIQSQGHQAKPPSLRPTTPAQASQVFGRPPPPSWGTQDARSNLAIQPAAGVSTTKLKKKTVKIVGAAAPSNTAPKPLPAPSTSSSPAPMMKKEQEANHYTTPAPATPTLIAENSPPKVEMPGQNKLAGNSLDEMFTRLMTPKSQIISQATEAVLPIRSGNAMFALENRLSQEEVGKKVLGDLVANAPIRPAQSKHEEPTQTEIPQQKQSSEVETKSPLRQSDCLSEADWESRYMQKASEYIDALPGSKDTSAHIFRSVTKKLRSIYATGVQLPSEEIRDLKARYIFAVVQYVKGLKKSAPELTTTSVKQILDANKGDVLQLCVALVLQGHIASGNLEEIVGLCKNVLDILPTPESDVASPALKGAVQIAGQMHLLPHSNPLSKDPGNGMSAWPSPEKREHPAGFRTCILKGIWGVNSVHQLQALVWGGKMEAISMPDGSGIGIVRFLTVEGCQKYYEATKNGIEIHGSDKEKKTVVLVERTEGPNSINDVMRACAEGDASRCVRAVGADEDWPNTLLVKLARGTEKVKRELDTIKQGKTSRGFNYVEFRFANIYHALSFKRELLNDEEWEHCNISFATDPCEIAQGVHYKDAE